jgi:hypothetical protein
MTDASAPKRPDVAGQSPAADAENRENRDSPQRQKGGTVPIFPIFRSLVWVLPERVARRLAWTAVALLAVVPVAIVLTLIARDRADRPPSRLAALLTKRLVTGVRLADASADASGRYELSGLTADDLELAAARGGYHPAVSGLGGRLDLENGSFALSLDGFAKPPGLRLQKLLADARAHDDLRALSLAGFSAELTLAGARVPIERVAVSVEIAPDGPSVPMESGSGSPGGGKLRGALTARSDAAPLRLNFEIGDASQSVTVTATRLPWGSALLAPTLGDAIAGLIEFADGSLTVGSALATGDESDAFQLAAGASLDLARLPSGRGLEGIAARLEMTLRASGPLGRGATVHATLSVPRGGSITPAALRQIAWLFDATPATVDEKKPLAFESLDLVVIITRDQIYFTGPGTGRPAGLYAPGGSPLLAIPSKGIPLRDFARRLDELKRRWEAMHAG